MPDVPEEMIASVIESQGIFIRRSSYALPSSMRSRSMMLRPGHGGKATRAQTSG